MIKDRDAAGRFTAAPASTTPGPASNPASAVGLRASGHGPHEAGPDRAVPRAWASPGTQAPDH